MKWKTVISLVVALALGALAAKIGKDVLEQRRSQDAGSARTFTKVVVAKKSLRSGHGAGCRRTCA